MYDEITSAFFILKEG
uniref:Uncharacterized protein n=1 Tax=Rhizophora mucronata TaxID=61149 RepID=A0A2P2QIH1_RHIMU